MDSPRIPSDELNKYLPNHVIREVLGIKDPNQLANRSTSPFNSPQIPPLESRLHDYLLGANLRKQVHCQLNLSDIFNSLEVQKEIQHELENMGSHEISLFAAFQKERIFEQAEQEIQQFLLLDKENISPGFKRHKLN